MCWRATCPSSLCASPTAAVPDLLIFHVQAAAAAVLKPVSLFRKKVLRPLRSINYTTWQNYNQATRHGLTPNRQPIPTLIPTLPARQQYSEPHVHISCVCAPGTSVPRGHTQQLHAPVPTSAVPSSRSRAWVRPAACARVIRNVNTFKQAVQYQTCLNQLIFLIFLVPQHGGRDVMWKHPIR